MKLAIYVILHDLRQRSQGFINCAIIANHHRFLLVVDNVQDLKFIIWVKGGIRLANIHL